MQIKANKNQELSFHLLNVANLSRLIIDNLDINEDSFFNKDKIAKLAYYAGLLHDIGKTDPIFQRYLNDKTTTDYNPNGIHIEKIDKKNKFSFEDHPRHNEISWFLVEELFNHKDFKINKIEYKILKNVILWHHSAPIRKDDFDSIKIINALKKEKKEFLNNIETLFKDINLNIEKDDLKSVFDSDKKEFVNYKSFFQDNQDKDIDEIQKDIKCEAIASLIRSIVTTADRHISANGNNINEDKILNDIFEKNKYSELITSIEKMEKSFFPDTERSNKQTNAAIKLNDINNQGDVAILNAPAGAGKTKVALQWAKNNNASKIYYIVPRTIIAEEIFDEFKNVYLKKGVSFEIITGEKQLKWTGKKEVILEDVSMYYNSDIIITTIDQLIKSTTTHKNISILQDIILSHVIFDEYHEYYKMSGFDLLFAEFIRIKSAFTNPKTLIMSATPNYFMLEHLLDIYTSSSSNIVSFKTENTKEYNLKYAFYDEELAIASSESLFYIDENNVYKQNKSLNLEEINKHPFLKTWDDKKTIVISNTATMAQKSFLLNNEDEDGLLAHSKFKQDDKKDILSHIKTNFKNIDKGCKILRAGPIVQASLNITSERLITELSTPEKIIQRLGRLNRFGEDFVGEFIIAIPYKAIDHKLKTRSNVLTLLNQNNEKESTLLWLEFLFNELKNKETDNNFKLDMIYKIYENYYKDKNTQNILEKELLLSIKKSYNNIRNNILNPTDIIGEKVVSNVKKMSKQSLRGKSYNSKMAIYHLGNNELSLTDDYSDNVSLPRNLILLYDENYYFIKETVKKHELLFAKCDKKVSRTLKKAKKEKSDKYHNFVLDLSRSEDFNIYTSFSKTDLQKFNKKENNEEAYVYIKTEKQNIGYLKLKQLIK